MGRSEYAVRIEKLKKNISNFNNLKLDNVSQDVVRRIINKIMRRSIYAPANILLPRIFRAQITTGEIFSNRDRLWYAKGENLNKINIGRLNHANKAVLYACSSLNGSINEVRAKIGDVVSVSEIVQDAFCPILCIPIGFGDSNEPLMKYLYHHSYSYHNLQMQTLIKEGSYNYFMMVDKFVGDIITRKYPKEQIVNGYVATNQVAYIFRNSGCMAIAYPSVESNNRYMNFRILPSEADKYFRINEIIQFKIIDIEYVPEFNGRRYITKPLYISEEILPSGHIKWKNIKGFHIDEIKRLGLGSVLDGSTFMTD